MTSWTFAIDRGGTFTDLVARDPNGRLIIRKVLSEQPNRPGDPAVHALREVIALEKDQPIPPGLIYEVRLGTTVATNALLEQRGEPVLLLINRGLADLPTIGDQHRPDLFALRIDRAKPLNVRVLEVAGRLSADGHEVEPLCLNDSLEQEVLAARDEGYRSCAVSLLHSYRNPIHEQQLGAWLVQLGLDPVLSHQVSRQPRILSRTQTTLVEAALDPILNRYLNQVRHALGPDTRLRVMSSSGALLSQKLLLAKDTILSGPAGGMVGAVEVARNAGFGDGPILGFDMGGTSTDVFHFDGSLGETGWERQTETELHGLRVQAPMLPIHTVAAGGGSVLHFDGLRLQVGPRSAGADPGPACYRRGGPLTITDANLLLGRLPGDALPAVFGPHDDQPADSRVVHRLFEQLAVEMGHAAGAPLTAEQVAQGALEIAIERMAEAIRRITIQRGHDIRHAVLVSYGGAGGQHACALADALGITRVLLHPLAGVLSAYGIGLSKQQLLQQRSVRQPLEPDRLVDLQQQIEHLITEGSIALRDAGDLTQEAKPSVQVQLELRYSANDHGLEVPWPENAPDPLLALQQAFYRAHHQRYGYLVEEETLVVERLMVELVATGDPQIPGSSTNTEKPPAELLQTRVCLADPAGSHLQWRSVPCWRREDLRPGQDLQGPALVMETTGTTLIEPQWGGRLLVGGELLLHRLPRQLTTPALAIRAQTSQGLPDPVRLELYNHRFSAIAEQMGVRLQQSSRSVNIRERLDFSCALFDSQGQLVANAPHIPVHLGSMGESVVSLLRAVRAHERPPLKPGDAIAANNPYNGGTHLPDITVITPVFPSTQRSDPLFFVACRGHHADVGGITPGSMPPFSTTIEQEGLLLDNEMLLSDGHYDQKRWQERLTSGPFPVRNPDQLLADLQAQVAANRLGVEELHRLIAREGLEEVQAYMGHVQANAAEAVRRVIDRLHEGHHAVKLDHGSEIRVAVRIDRASRRAVVDFSGTSPQHFGNFNAPLAVTKAVVLYAFRCLVGESIPLNAGCFEPIELLVPPGSLLHPTSPAAVVAGNVETSQATVNALFGALGVMAAAQGTMNNLSFGNDSSQYYETICGGSGAGTLADGTGFAGASAVQCHMTNSRLTDPEILEDRFPVRLERFAIRTGSGGVGRWPGGDGVVRQLLFLAPMTVAILSGSRQVPPFGLHGGAAGQVGVNRLERENGTIEWLAGCAEMEVLPGDRLVIETPGGGGCWPSARRQKAKGKRQKFRGESKG